MVEILIKYKPKIYNCKLVIATMALDHSISTFEKDFSLLFLKLMNLHFITTHNMIFLSLRKWNQDFKRVPHKSMFYNHLIVSVESMSVRKC